MAAWRAKNLIFPQYEDILCPFKLVQTTLYVTQMSFHECLMGFGLVKYNNINKTGIIGINYAN